MMKTMIFNHPPVKRRTANFTLTEPGLFKTQMLNWANRFNICVLLDNHQYDSPHHSVECLLAAGVRKKIQPGKDKIAQLKIFYQETNDWIFGHVGYDFKNELEPLSSTHFDGIGFPDLFFFQPEVVIQLSGDELSIGSVGIPPEEIFSTISGEIINDTTAACAVNLQARISRQVYLTIVDKLKQHILRGDCYEINFCQEFFAEQAGIDPLFVYRELTRISPTPFACYYKLDDKYLLCASPERYLKKTGDRIISQPIKGTFKRNYDDPLIDETYKNQLQQSAKDRSENVMVVDLVRNDLSKVCKEGSVKVEELFGIYSFPQVHQMISTISGELEKETGLAKILQAAFPMGSMTGAPKRKVMELIEKYEQTKRGIYSGCVGYINPDKDFDFNVVIRSILYNSKDQYLSYQVGGGITFNSDAEKEYEECLLKAEAIKKVLQPQHSL